MKEWWTALTTFERRGAGSSILPDWAQGACGWLAVWAADEDDARQSLARDLAAMDLRLVDVDQAQPIGAQNVNDWDERLSENLFDAQPGRETVWGSIHCYAADGEA